MDFDKDIRIIKPLKEGGQKKVYLAESNTLGTVIYKVGQCHSISALERIKREVDLLRRIKSPYFPQNYAFRYDSNGIFQMIEEYIESKSLGECIHFFDTEMKIAQFALELINGMKLLWDNRIVHRDLKPDNILIKNTYQPVIIDLGIARDLEDMSLTKTILQRGPCTPVYASPEQLKNMKDCIDVRTDFFSIGIILCELFLKVHPFHPQVVGEGLGIVENIEAGRYSLQYADKKMSTQFESIVKKLLEVKQYNRYRTYMKFEEELLMLVS
jgi:serine/threonine protein kinase